MSNRPLPVLTDQQAAILFVVWEEKQSARSKGMTNAEIQQAVVKSRRNRRGASLANVKKIIEHLEDWQPPLLFSSRAGKQATIFQLPKDTMVTWPSTARLLLQLEAHPDGTVDRDEFVQDILYLDMKNPVTRQPLTKADIEKQIGYCIDRVFPYIEQDNRGFIKATNRVSSERPFLERIEKFYRPIARDAKA